MRTSSAEPAVGPVMTVRGLRAGYGDAPVVDGVDLDLACGRVVAVVGPNGAGKSTLVKALLGLTGFVEGEVVIDGQVVTGVPLERLARIGVGYVPQVDDAFESLRVRENLEMGGYLLPRRERARRIERVLGTFPALRPRLDRYVETLSGGERKMTALARVLMLEPRLLLLDEPTASLSLEVSRVVLDEVRKLADLGKAVLLVEQRATAALAIADWAYVMVRGSIAMSAPAQQVLQNAAMRELFLGARAPAGG
jgi:ABC-type branched-subunit amino acid transport system ATPase component